MAGNRKGKHDVAPMVRGAFLSALDLYKERHGKTFSETICDLLEEDPLGVLNAVSKFTVREKDVTVEQEVTVTHRISEHLPVNDIRSKATEVERRLN